MEAGTQTSLPGTDRRPGRKGKDGGEEIIKFSTIKERSAEQMKLIRRADSAKNAMNDGFKALAEASGTNVSNLKKLFKASFNGNFKDVQRDIDQQQVLFETLGEIPGGGGKGAASGE